MATRISILMIDDNSADGDIVRRYLSDEEIPWDIKFELAHTLEESQKKLAAEEFDIILLDYRFPFGNGFDLLSRLRQSGIEKPVIMLTGKGSEEVAGQAVKEDLSDYLPKDELSPGCLKTTLESILQPEIISRGGKGKVETGDSVSVRFNDFRINKFFSILSKKLKNDRVLNFLFVVIRKDKSKVIIARVEDFFIQKVDRSFLKIFPGKHKEYIFLSYLESSEKPVINNPEEANELLDELIETLEQPGRIKEEKSIGLIAFKVKSKDRVVDPAYFLNRVLDKISTDILAADLSAKYFEIEIEGVN